MELALKNIGKQYRGKWVLTGVDETFGKGVYGILGPNGAGKTTMLRILATVLQASKGEVRWDQKEILSMGEAYRALLGYLPQHMDFYDHFTGYDFLKYMYLLKGGKEKKPKQLEELLQRVHLSHVSDKKISTYSGGMKQRLAIAQAFIGEPELLLLDEPTVGLDLEERAEFKKMVREQGNRAIVILSTHIVSDVEETADSVLFVSEGKIIERNTSSYYQSYIREQGLEGLEQYYFQLAGRGLDDRSDQV